MFQCTARINGAWIFCLMQLIATNSIKAICFVMIKENIVMDFDSPVWISALELTRPQLIHCGKDTIKVTSNSPELSAPPCLQDCMVLIHYLSFNILLPDKLAQFTKTRPGSAQHITFLLPLHIFSIHNLKLGTDIGKLKPKHFKI